MVSLLDADDSLIPELDEDGLIPPIPLDDPVNNVYRSPYKISMRDLIYRFGSSPKRCEILRGFVNLRHVLVQNGFSGFQWIGGSFIENGWTKNKLIL